jgi:purine-cytosine permease-like protein
MRTILSYITLALVAVLVYWSPTTASQGVPNRVSGRKVLSDGVATTAFKLNVANNSAAGCIVRFAVVASDASNNQQVITRQYSVAATQVATVFTTNLSVGVGAAIAQSSGTLTVTPSIVNGTDQVEFAINADSSLTSPTITVYYIVDCYNQQITPN